MKKKDKFHNFSERVYNMDALERQLLGIDKPDMAVITQVSQKKEKLMEKEKKEVVTILMNEAFVKENLVAGNGTIFHSVVLPKGTTLNGTDLGGYQFNPMYINKALNEENQILPHMRSIPLLAGNEVWLRKTKMDAEGHPIKNAEGKVEKDTIKISPTQLKAVLDLQYQTYIKRSQITLMVNQAFVREAIPYLAKDGTQKTFHSVTIPKGTVLENGTDVGGYQFYPNTLVHSTKEEYPNMVFIPLRETDQIVLKKQLIDEQKQPILDEKGLPKTVYVTVLAKELKQGFTNAHQRYKESRESSKEPPRKTPQKGAR